MTMSIYYLYLVLLSRINFAVGQTREDFVKALLTNYDSRIPPNYEKDYPCDVNVSLLINSIDSINEQSMDFTLSTFISQVWTDTRLRFMNLIDAEYLELDARLIERVWVPDLYFRNEKKAHFHSVTIPNRMLHIYQDGTVVYKSRVTLTASCPMRLRKYPLDRQKCTLILQSFAYTTKRLTFTWQEFDPVRLSAGLELPQFTPYFIDTTNCTKPYDENVNTCLQLDLYLERNIGFYMIQLYIPSVLIVMLSWLSFWLHVDAVPARISLGILTVLTMTTQRSMASAPLPRVSYVKAIDVWVAVCMCFVVVAALLKYEFAIDVWMAVCLCFVVAALLEYAFVNVLARSRKVKLERVNGQNIETKVGLIEGNIKKTPEMMVKDQAQFVDNLSRILFPVAFVLFCLTYSLIYGSMDDEMDVQ